MSGRIVQIAGVAALTLALGCGVPVSDDGELGASELALTMPAHEVQQVLALVNAATTTFDLLNDEVRLDSRAAQNIVTHRAGPDGVYPSGDDRSFQTIEALDAIPWVGDVALGKLRDYALLHAPPPPELVKNVHFSSEQVAAVLWGVNRASFDELDNEVQLDRRAAQGLVDTRPFTTVTAMGKVAWMGTVSLQKLRDHAVIWSAQRSQSGSQAGKYDGVLFDEPTAQATLAIAQTASAAQLTANGLPGAGANAIVGGRPYQTLGQVANVYGVGAATMQALHGYATALLAAGATTSPTAPQFGDAQDGDDCDAANLCAQGLVCSGLTFSPGGFCRPQWMAGTFTSTTHVVIPDASPAGITSTLLVSGLASVPEDVVLNLDIDHPRKGDLLVKLAQPNGGDEGGPEATVWAVGSNGAARVVVGNGIERDYMVNGTWTLTVVDTVTGEAGALKGWSLELTSRWD